MYSSHLTQTGEKILPLPAEKGLPEKIIPL